MRTLSLLLLACCLVGVKAYSQLDIVWSNMVHTYAIPSEDTICCDTNAGAWGHAGAFSLNMLPDASDGYVQLTYQGSGEIAFGFSDKDIDQDIKTIDYGFEVTPSIVKVWINGSVKSTLSAPRTNDVYTIDKVSGGNIDLKVNQVSVHSETAPSTDLHIDASFYDDDCIGGLETDVEGPQIPSARPFKLPSAGFYRTYEKLLRVEFVEEYQLDDAKYLTYKIYDDNNDVVASVTEGGVTAAGSDLQLVQRGENYIELSLASLGLSNGEIYLAEFENRKQEKVYLRFVYEADMPN